MHKPNKKDNLPAKHKTVASRLRVGKENATLMSDICSIAEISERVAYSIIESLINDYGYVIVASRSGEHKGYYIPSNDVEFMEAVQTFRNEYMSMQKRYESLMSNYIKRNGKGKIA